MSALRSSRVRNIIIVGVVIVVILLSLAYYMRIGPFTTSNPYNETYYYPISIDYNGSWKLVYWGQNGSAMQYGSLNGSGNFETTPFLLAPTPSQVTLCANATKLDSSQNNLTLKVLFHINSTAAPYGSTENCGTVAAP